MEKKYRITEHEGFTRYENQNGAVLGVSGAAILEVDGYAFKDLSGTGELLPYEDWRLPAKERAKDLAERISIEEIAGLMLYSSHQMVPFRTGGPFQAHYQGKSYEEVNVPKWTLTDEQKAFVTDDHVRHILLMIVDDTETSAKWSNELQKLAESQKWGIPVNISSDPRHGAASGGAEYKSAAGSISAWPEGIGMTATGSETMWRNYARAVSAEYRAMGITTALGPQVDLATEPRWMRLEDTFGSDLETSIRMASIICDEMQTTPDAADGWGDSSVAVMAKHWPGGGTGESGRDAHYGYGKFAVYPGDRFKEHMRVFTEGALNLEGPTGKAASIMPYYTVSFDQDKADHENVGNSYSYYIIHDLLREKYGYDGVLCTDWGITGDPSDEMDSFGSRCYGVEQLSVAERHLRIIMNGVDQFGGNNESGPILEAYRIGCERYGTEEMEAVMRTAARRLLTNIFRLGLFENPYLDPEESKKITGCEKFRQEGMEAQKASIVLLKNQNEVLPLKKGIKVYIPEREIRAGRNFFRMPDPERKFDPVGAVDTQKYFERVMTPEEADAAIVFIESPLSNPYDKADREQGGNGYFPITLRYRPYTAVAAREESLAQGDFREKEPNRSYKGKTVTARNESDLDHILDTRKVMKDKPVIVALRMHNPTVVGEFEPYVDGLFAEFGVSADAIFDVIFGDYDPKGTLPVYLPADMDVIEQHCEDISDDFRCYQDASGHIYQFGYGLSYGHSDENNIKL